MIKTKPAATLDPCDRQPPGLEAVRRADGRGFYNGYLWPTESWWLGHEHRSFDSRWMFGYVALNDGRFCVKGHDYLIRGHFGVDASDNQNHGDTFKLQNNFPTREAAIRAACARLIVTMRHARTWGYQYAGMTGERLAFAINWARQTCARACQQPAPPDIHLPEPAPPPPPAQPFADLPLFSPTVNRQSLPS